MIRSLLAGAVRGISHPNTDLDAQTFLLRVRQLRAEAGSDPAFPVAYRPQVTLAELDDPRVLIWDIGRSHDPVRGNFDHHQEHRLGATPILLLEALGVEPSALDRYVDLADRGIFFREPQPLPYVETLQGISAGIHLVYPTDDVRSDQFQDLLAWVEQSGAEPFGRFDEGVLPARFHPAVQAVRAEQAEAARAAAGARWLDTAIGKVAFIATDVVGAMRVLYEQSAALVILHEAHGQMSGWSSPVPKFTVGANPALVAVPDRLDLRPLFARLSTLEPSGHTWGGQAGIGGSPREEGGSGLSAEQVVREVIAYVG